MYNQHYKQGRQPWAHAFVVGDTLKHCTVPSSDREKAALTITYARQAQHASNYPQLGTYWLTPKPEDGTPKVTVMPHLRKAQPARFSYPLILEWQLFIVWIFSGNSRIPSKAKALGHLAGTELCENVCCLLVRFQHIQGWKIGLPQKPPGGTQGWPCGSYWMRRNFGEKPFMTTLIVAWLSSLTRSFTGLPSRRSHSWREGKPSAYKECARLITSAYVCL